MKMTRQKEKRLLKHLVVSEEHVCFLRRHTFLKTQLLPFSWQRDTVGSQASGFNSLRPVCRLLEHQLQSQRRTYDNEVESLRGELQNVKEENNRQQQLLAQNLQLPPEARIEASLQHEITRLTNENLVRCKTDACWRRRKELISQLNSLDVWISSIIHHKLAVSHTLTLCGWCHLTGAHGRRPHSIPRGSSQHFTADGCT